MRKFNFWYPWLIFGLFFLASYWLMQSNFQVRDGQLLIASKSYSDFAVHLPLIRSFSFGQNTPPEYPVFSGEPIRYHYLFYLFVGLLEKSGINLGFAFNVMSALGCALLMFMIYKIAVLFFNKIWVGWLAVLLLIFNGSLTWLEFYKGGFSGWQALFNLENFLSFGPWDSKIVSAFWNWNIYTNQRHLGLSFGLLLLVVWPLLVMFVKRRAIFNVWWSLLVLVALTFFPLLHQVGYLILVALILWLGGLLWLENRQQELPGFILMARFYLLGLVFSIPLFLAVPHDQEIIWQRGFLAPEKDLLGIIKYWFFNLGLYLPLLPLVWWQAEKKSRRLIEFAFFLLILANLGQFSRDMINNHKFVNFFVILLNIFLAGWLMQLHNQKKWWLNLAIIALLPFLTLGGIVDFFPIKNDRFIMLADVANNSTATWIKENTFKSARFVTNSFMYHPASLAGRRLFIDYGYHAWSMGYDDQSRRKVWQKLYDARTSKDEKCRVLRSNNLDYLAVGRGDDGTTPVFSQEWQSVYNGSDGVRIYKTSDNCVNTAWKDLKI